MNTARLPSGDVTAVRGSGAAPTAASPAAACAASSAHGRTGVLARRARDVARPAPRLDVERHRLPVGGEFDRLERQLLRIERAAGRGAQRRRQLHVIERRHLRRLDGIDEEELDAVSRRAPVGEAVVGQPGARDAAADDERRERWRQELLGARVVVGRGGGRCVGRPLLRGERRNGGERRQQEHNGQRERAMDTRHASAGSCSQS